MIQKSKIIMEIVESGVVAVIRTESEEKAIQISSASMKGGIRSIEVTLTVPGAADVISMLTKKPEFKNLLVGAGSVLDSETARIAILAGAKYIVSPCFDQGTAILCNRYQIPYMPGCMTVTEMKTAMEYGAEIVKMFPGNHFSPSIVKSIKGPLPQVSIMPTGGVNLENAKEWIKSGAVAVGIGSDLAAPAKKGNYEEVTSLAKQYCDLVKEARAEM
ncbi:bifunctional 2-keto-4-hydroxyglutarate aldolase/2-keto-3-deoxy-6-phosphogluconate aldolase [Salipaludibacillus neizhouensis]|uniref:Bifunctional 2-keto-4-hydroxyglutarate aldolase/2-keto-3-deoxy-6-phosphogluconate aldolase n=1 Tax=Salipaludibacillus neizhouensis TaxID=885475 RepID=A0A3A9KCB2_9BACI|nr:bifunctional 2-keto-4-hydroxyglutarate aldolase/2-keto-3-deoxy-6-phosphogluconate aldolase [Salipaludibacillus neizhouensis]RKL68131.1 bifunctional 2-keto-4-hydroxyglutarate aldolase/2-keto-3-deoxy-6-phosphogluconate aldolase [Salipaludibacillus neizhouensis]